MPRRASPAACALAARVARGGLLWRARLAPHLVAQVAMAVLAPARVAVSPALLAFPSAITPAIDAPLLVADRTARGPFLQHPVACTATRPDERFTRFADVRALVFVPIEGVERMARIPSEDVGRSAWLLHRTALEAQHTVAKVAFAHRLAFIALPAAAAAGALAPATAEGCLTPAARATAVSLALKPRLAIAGPGEPLQAQMGQ